MKTPPVGRGSCRRVDTCRSARPGLPESRSDDPSSQEFEVALLPVEIGFWIGFALPIPPVLALVRLLLLVAGWSALR